MKLTSLSLFLGFLLIIGLPALSGCGIKPSEVDPPKSAKPDTFPRTYPAPEMTNPPQPAQ